MTRRVAIITVDLRYAKIIQNPSLNLCSYCRPSTSIKSQRTITSRFCCFSQRFLAHVARRHQPTHAAAPAPVPWSSATCWIWALKLCNPRRRRLSWGAHGVCGWTNTTRSPQLGGRGWIMDGIWVIPIHSLPKSY